MKLFNMEPVAVTAFIRALILVITAFGLKLSAEQIAAIMVLVEAGLALFTRTKVVPAVNVPTPSATTTNVVPPPIVPPAV